MIAGETGIGLVDLAFGHRFDFLQHARDRIDGGFDVDHHPALETGCRLAGDAQHIDLAITARFGHQTADLGSADVQSDDEFLEFPSHVHLPLPAPVPTAG